MILGRGGAGKTTLASRMGLLTGLPVIELDQLFWRSDGSPTPLDRWVEIQRELVRRPGWILDGDLGPFDALEPRLRAADTVTVLDYSLVRCAWQSIRRSTESVGYWRWMLWYRRRSLPGVMADIATHASGAGIHVLRSPRSADALLALAS